MHALEGPVVPALGRSALQLALPLAEAETEAAARERLNLDVQRHVELGVAILNELDACLQSRRGVVGDARKSRLHSADIIAFTQNPSCCDLETERNKSRIHVRKKVEPLLHRETPEGRGAKASDIRQARPN